MTEPAKAGLAAASLCLAILAYLWACSSSANPLPIRYVNPGTTTAYDAIEVVSPGLAEPISSPSACAPGATCEVIVAVQPGTYPDLRIRARAGSRTSPLSNGRDEVVPVPTPCTFDVDGNGALTASDFAAFYRSWLAGYWTTADFGTFMTRFARGSCM